MKYLFNYIVGTIIGGLSLGYLIGLSTTSIAAEILPILLLMLFSGVSGLSLLVTIRKKGEEVELRYSQKFLFIGALILMIAVGTSIGVYFRANLILVDSKLLDKKITIMVADQVSAETINMMKGYGGINASGTEEVEDYCQDLLNLQKSQETFDLAIGKLVALLDEEGTLARKRQTFEHNANQQKLTEIQNEGEFQAYVEAFKRHLACE